MDAQSTTTPPALRALLSELRQEIREQCPDLAVRVTYAPYQHIDAFLEVYADTGTIPPPLLAQGNVAAIAFPLTQMAEARFEIDDAEVYTVAVLVHESERMTAD